MWREIEVGEGLDQEGGDTFGADGGFGSNFY